MALRAHLINFVPAHSGLFWSKNPKFEMVLGRVPSAMSAVNDQNVARPCAEVISAGGRNRIGELDNGRRLSKVDVCSWPIW